MIDLSLIMVSLIRMIRGSTLEEGHIVKSSLISKISTSTEFNTLDLRRRPRMIMILNPETLISLPFLRRLLSLLRAREASF
jgi:hypothetical protein